MSKVTYADITIERTRHAAWLLSAIVDGHLVTRQYLDYTKREAMRLFHDEVNTPATPYVDMTPWVTVRENGRGVARYNTKAYADYAATCWSIPLHVEYRPRHYAGDRTPALAKAGA